MDRDNVVHSDVTGKDYYPSQVVRLVNIRQICSYMRLGKKPIDIYPSIDFKSSNPVLVVLFDRNDTKDAYNRWCDSTNLWEELQNEANDIYG